MPKKTGKIKRVTIKPEQKPKDGLNATSYSGYEGFDVQSLTPFHAGTASDEEVAALERRLVDPTTQDVEVVAETLGFFYAKKQQDEDTFRVYSYGADKTQDLVCAQMASESARMLKRWTAYQRYILMAALSKEEDYANIPGFPPDQAAFIIKLCSFEAGCFFAKRSNGVLSLTSEEWATTGLRDVPQALQLLHRAAKKGSDDAAIILHELTTETQGADAGLRVLEQCAQEYNIKEAMTNLACTLLDAPEPKRDVAQALELLRRATELGDWFALVRLVSTLTKEGREKDVSKLLLGLLKQAETEPSRILMPVAGRAREVQEGAMGSPNQVPRGYEGRKDEKGNSMDLLVPVEHWAYYMLSHCSALTDKERAMWLKRAAAAKVPAAMCNLGIWKSEGARGLALDPKGGRALLHAALEAGIADAAGELGRHHLEGVGGLERDEEAAERFFEQYRALTGKESKYVQLVRARQEALQQQSTSSSEVFDKAFSPTELNCDLAALVDLVLDGADVSMSAEERLAAARWAVESAKTQPAGATDREESLSYLANTEHASEADCVRGEPAGYSWRCHVLREKQLLAHAQQALDRKMSFDRLRASDIFFEASLLWCAGSRVAVQIVTPGAPPVPDDQALAAVCRLTAALVLDLRACPVAGRSEAELMQPLKLARFDSVALEMLVRRVTLSLGLPSHPKAVHGVARGFEETEVLGDASVSPPSLSLAM